MVNFGRNAPPIALVLASLILWASFGWALPAEAPATEGEAETEAADPWAGVRVSDAYDYAKCPRCGKKNELRAERCSRCDYEFPQPSAEMSDPAWVFVPGRGYHREGTLLERGKFRKVYWVTGLVLAGSGITTMIVAGSLAGWWAESEGSPERIAFGVGLGATAGGVVLLAIGFASRVEPVYALESGDRYGPYERPGLALNSPDSDGLAFKVEVTVLGF